jgi:acetyl-CoA carboxylase biotin carboxyl carrier protein
MELTPAEIQEILRIFVDSEMRELQIQVGEMRLAVSKDGAVSAEAPVSPASPLAPHPSNETVRPSEGSDPAGETPGAEREREPGLIEVRSPLVGVFYRRPAPDLPPHVEVGDLVRPEDAVCTIAIMKMFTEVKAGVTGRVAEICVADEAFVEHGQTLLLIEPIPVAS